MLYYKKIENAESSEWVILLHGIGGNSNVFKKQLDLLSTKYNLLLIDLHGHGNSKQHNLMTIRTKERHVNLKYVCDDIVEVMDKEEIKKANFMGISLGTIVILNMSIYYEERIESMILGGAIIGMTMRSKIILNFVDFIRQVIPYIAFRQLMGNALMPFNKHKNSRKVYLKASDTLEKKEFVEWFKLLKYHLKNFNVYEYKIPTLYVMGDKDFVFLPSIQKHIHSNNIKIISDCGHVCNVDCSEKFNDICMNFLLSTGRTCVTS